MGQGGPESDGNEGISPRSPKLQHYWRLTNRSLSVISRTLIGGPFHRAVVIVFYTPPNWAAFNSCLLVKILVRLCILRLFQIFRICGDIAIETFNKTTQVSRDRIFVLQGMFTEILWEMSMLDWFHQRLIKIRQNWGPLADLTYTWKLWGLINNDRIIVNQGY